MAYQDIAMRTEAGFPWKFDTAAGAVGIFIVVHEGDILFSNSDKGTEVTIVRQASIMAAYKNRRVIVDTAAAFTFKDRVVFYLSFLVRFSGPLFFWYPKTEYLAPFFSRTIAVCQDFSFFHFHL